MKAKTLTTKYLSALNDGFEAVETDDGFVVWMPAYYSDDDGVILSVRRAAGGWTVTDDGSTLSGLRTRGAATDAPAFLEAWGRLTRPAGDFVPGRDSDDGEITGWATDETLGDVLNLVALASVRAEGLALIRERGSAERFPARVGRRITSLMSAAECTDRGLVRGSTVGLVSGRRKRVTAAVEHAGATLAVFQALGGGGEQARERSYEHCHTIFSQAQIERERRFAVVEDPGAWDPVVLDEVRDVGVVLPYEDQDAFDARFAEIVRRLPAPAPA